MLVEDYLKSRLMTIKTLIQLFVLAVLCLITSSHITAQSVDKGKELFKNRACAACHDIKMKTDLVGPNLKDVEERWESKEELFGYIKNPQSFLDKGHKYATKLFEKYNRMSMPPTVGITDKQLESILQFIKSASSDKVEKKESAIKQPEKIKEVEAHKTESTFWDSWAFYILLLVVFVVLSIILFKVLEFRIAIRLVLLAIAIGVVYFATIKGVKLGNQQGYQPTQPIAFSHKVHAGDNAINCQFCHDAASKSRHAGVPGSSTCMKCHKAIKTGSRYGTQELTKIYASIGFDPSKGRYIDNYNNLSQEQIKEVFAAWLNKNNDEDEGEKQWKNIVSSLTNDYKKEIQGNIEWIRIHNLPDHVYFNHSQHVNVAKMECQDCHGQVKDMEVVGQVAPLTMGWCIDCHRRSEIKIDSNGYYNEYFIKYHEEMNKGQRSKITVEDVGGLDCNRCHY